ncbi:hypothetical protein HUZ43_17770 [Raoultella ornithinolytica]|uniref:hypothetical protein n=1 Tax=Klebsiella/Raoultella group TaxID=2890311 RepID=UPI0015EA0C34|nr:MULTISPECIES: hypothetical protein [Klebsiella/Raoultella group]MBF8461214.1 hypothetical protein [Klebsiella michiganensis]QMR54534.1 hypothetical protein HV264_06090 [Klebsiella michiganensis]ULI45842.1 hypothetical protein HUZ43_17770 [Raoultella ornithinolytica]
MTSKLTITDERLAELVAFKPLPGTDINSATRDEWMAMAAELHERRKAASEPVAYLVCNGRLYQDRAFMSPLMAEESVKNRNDSAEIKALCVCGKAECAE